MASFLKDITPFYGTNVNNELGQDLEHFLEIYDANKYPNPSVTADVLVVQHEKDMKTVESGLKLLMIQRKNHPSIGFWALPGGFVEINENLDEAAKRELFEETGIEGLPVQQMHCFGNVKRDPRTRIITVSYLALVEKHLIVKAGDDAADALWFDVHISKVSEQVIDKRNVVVYDLKLENRDKNLCLEASIEYSELIKGILKDPQYHVIKANHIAFDHPAFIMQALLYIQSVLTPNK